MKEEESYIKDNDALKRAVHHAAQDDALEDIELGLLVKARKTQEEIEVNIGAL